jgi:MFS family permease
MIWAGIILGYALAAVLVVVRIARTDSTAGEVLGSIAFGVAASVAPTVALLSLDRRPGLLPAASLIAILMGVVGLTLLPFWLLLALGWGWAHNRRPVKAEVSRPLWWGRAAMAFGVVLSVFVLFVHLDPYCTETMADGTVRQIDPADKGMSSGWRFGSTTSQWTDTSQSGFDGPVSSHCTSDTIVWGEAVASMLLSLTVVGAALRWPINSDRRAPAPGVTAAPNVS